MAEEPYTINITSNLDAAPWDDLPDWRVREATVTRIGLCAATEDRPAMVTVLGVLHGRFHRMVAFELPVAAVVAIATRLAQAPIVIHERGLP